MSDIQKNVQNILGSWTGEQKLYLKPEEFTAEGPIHLHIAKGFLPNVIEIKYSHSLDESEYHGLFIITSLSEHQAEAAWIDNFHTNLGVMKLTGEFTPEGLSLIGGYDAEGEFWKWTIDFCLEEEILRITHFNHPPNQKAYVGVKIHANRSK